MKVFDRLIEVNHLSSNNEYVQNEVKSTPKSPSTEIKTRTLIGKASKNEIQFKSPQQTNTFHQRTQGSTLLIFWGCLHLSLKRIWMDGATEGRVDASLLFGRNRLS